VVVASDFDILPAIDLRGGRVVRLQQGDFARETAFSDDPVAVARSFTDAGARWLHVVDLDGARSGTPAHAQVIRSIVDAVGQRVSVEVAGGLRTSTAVADAIAAGAARAVVGTAALRDPDFAGDLVRRHGADRIAVAIDVRDGLAVGEGWRADAPGPAVGSIVTALADVGITTFEVTAIERDGLLGGPDLKLLSGLIGASRGNVIASGGVASLDDIRAVAAIGCAGAIVGRALYEGQLDIGAAIEAGRRTGTPDGG
jgi:phosphoribosylformimino-5-aminoimidazole carboxamide ribotide isomerase